MGVYILPLNLQLIYYIKQYIWCMVKHSATKQVFTIALKILNNLQCDEKITMTFKTWECSYDQHSKLEHITINIIR